MNASAMAQAAMRRTGAMRKRPAAMARVNGASWRAQKSVVPTSLDRPLRRIYASMVAPAMGQ